MAEMILSAVARRLRNRIAVNRALSILRPSVSTWAPAGRFDACQGTPIPRFLSQLLPLTQGTASNRSLANSS